jgi:diaminopimelate epimerase
MAVSTFKKMHGLGNDFVVFDAREQAVQLSAAAAEWVCDRHQGIGCDQILVVCPPRDPRSDVRLQIFNRRGQEVAICANGARCVASFVFRENNSIACVVDTGGRLIGAIKSENDLVTVDLQEMRFDWRDVPLTKAADTLHAPLFHGGLPAPACANIGNAHGTFFVENLALIDVNRLGGTGLTLACGSGACAAAVAAARRGLTGRRVKGHDGRRRSFRRMGRK